ncbi:MAG: universal stress protein [Bacteroidetes bacterium]|nr:universal stress protein [Bacteroidota bacterium]
MYSVKNILVPIDFSDFSKNALRYAVNFAEHFKAKLSLIYVVEPAIYPADFSMGQVSIPALDLDMTTRAKEELSKLVEAEIASHVESEVIIKSGKPFIEIIETASEKDVDLIIISTHGHTGVEHLLFGSTAEKVVRKAPCPVLTLREPLKGFKYTEKC